jgi:GT2 family glycosyltransferase
VNPAVSVVIPTCRRAALLERCLQALLRQDLGSADFELIVVDDTPDDATRRLVGRLSERPAAPLIRYLATQGRQGPATARNLGWRAARAPIIAFTDDDTIPEPSWLREGLAALRHGAAAAAGRVEVPLGEHPTDYERDAAGLSGGTFVTANCFCRKDALEAVGGFDQRYRAAWREDSDLQFALEDRGLRVVRAERAVVVHPVRPAPWGISLRQQRKSMFNALLYRKFPDRYRTAIQATPPRRYYAIVGALALGLALFPRRPRAAALPLLLWGCLTGQFCATRLRGVSHHPSHVAEMLVTSAAIPPLAIFWRLRGAMKFRVVFF